MDALMTHTPIHVNVYGVVMTHLSTDPNKNPFARQAFTQRAPLSLFMTLQRGNPLIPGEPRYDSRAVL